jgi:putative DNA primase/helicase
MDEAAFPPLVRDIVDAACNSSEAHPVAVAANVLAFFSCMIGRGAFQRIGDATIQCRPFQLIVGKSGKARKGTAEHTVREVFRRADALVRDELGNEDRLRVHAGGLSTGEGIAWAIRDPREADEHGKGADAGVNDKRLLVIESEFDNLLSQLRRENNTLSSTVRNLFDGRDMEPLTKTSQTRATRPHVVIIGHITGHELREKSTENDAANGLMNRFMLMYVFRPKLVPLPEPTHSTVIELLASKIAAAVIKITGGNLHAHNEHEIELSPAARAMWVAEYPRLTRDRDGKGGSLLARSELYARMLGMIFACMDGRHLIEPQDLRAAIAWVEYWHASVTYVFNTPDEADEMDPFTLSVLEVISQRPGITLTQLQDHWNRKRIKDVRQAVERLLNLAPPLIEAPRDKQTGGRAALKFHTYRKG